MWLSRNLERLSESPVLAGCFWAAVRFLTAWLSGRLWLSDCGSVLGRFGDPACSHHAACAESQSYLIPILAGVVARGMLQSRDCLETIGSGDLFCSARSALPFLPQPILRDC